MIRNIEVVPIVIHGMPGFQVQCLWCEGSDSFWERLAHDAVFRTEAAAIALRYRIRASARFDWKHWGVPVDRPLSNLDCIQAHTPVYSVL